MDERVTLRSHLDRSTLQTPHGAAVGAVIEAIAAAAIELAALIADGPLAGITGRNGGINSDGDQQKDIDVVADELMRRALRAAPVAAVLSEEAALPEILHPEAPLCVAIDPLDGSANLENNISVGTIFSIRPRGNDITLDLLRARHRASRGRFYRLRPANHACARARCAGRYLHPRPARRGVPVGAASRAGPARHAGICHQRLQSPALARAGSRLYRRLPRRHQGRRRGRFQHALDRLAGRGDAPHPGARRRVPLSGRRAARAIARAGCASCTRRIRWRW